MVEFNPQWYGKFISSTNEKDLLVSKIAEVLKGKPHGSCLEIGLGLSPYFAQHLAPTFNKYVIIEKRIVNEKLPKGVELINKDWEKIDLKEKSDVIIASHVFYYFKNKKAAIEKMFNLLNNEGRVIFVVNGKSADYGPLKLAFAESLGIKYVFTYDELLGLLKGRKFREYTFPSKVKFSSFEDLFETLRLSFDALPKEYQKIRDKIIEYLKNNIKGDSFVIDQKIIEVEK